LLEKAFVLILILLYQSACLPPITAQKTVTICPHFWGQHH